MNECDEDFDGNTHERNESGVDDGSDYDDLWPENHL